MLGSFDLRKRESRALLSSSQRPSRNRKTSLKDMIPSTRLLPASTITSLLTPVFFKNTTKPQLINVLLISWCEQQSLKSVWKGEMVVPGFANRSITFPRESDRKHIWHLGPLRDPYGGLESCPNCSACNPTHFLTTFNRKGMNLGFC